MLFARASAEVDEASDAAAQGAGAAGGAAESPSKVKLRPGATAPFASQLLFGDICNMAAGQPAEWLTGTYFT